jgi:hypothetical protein
MNDIESAAMWAQYVKSDGIVIKSTIGKLKECLIQEKMEVRIRKIVYKNYDTTTIDFKDCYLYKRESFIHEKELRGFLVRSGIFNAVRDDAEKHDFSKPYACNPAIDYKPGLVISTDARTLIDEVRIAPTAQGFLQQTVKAVMGKYEMGDKPVIQNDITKMPT